MGEAYVQALDILRLIDDDDDGDTIIIKRRKG